MKKFVSVFMVLILLSTSLCGCQSEEQSQATKEEEVVTLSTVHIYTTDETFESKLEYVYAKHEDWRDRIEVVTLAADGYAQTIETLFSGPQPVEETQESEGVEPQEYKYPDVIIVNTEDLLHFKESDTILSVQELGIKESDLTQMYAYTVSEATSEAGVLKGLSWKANPGAFIYRKSLAMDILGYDDENNVQSFLKDWDTFADTARVIDKKSSGSVKIVDKLDYEAQNLDISAIDMSDNNYFSSVNLGKVFGYFCTVDMLDKFDSACKGSARGDWAICRGPQNYEKGGAWMLAGEECSDKEFVGAIMKSLCCESDIQKKIFENDNEFINNMREISNAYNTGKGKMEVLGGGDYIAVYNKVAMKAK